MTRKPSQKELEIRERESRVLELRRAGFTLQRIADEVGYADPSGAKKAIKRYYDRLEAEANEHNRSEELERLDRLQVALWNRAVKGDDKAIRTVLRIMELRSKILGLHAPVKSQVEVINYELTGEYDHEVDELAEYFAELERRKETITVTEQQDQGITVYMETQDGAEGTTPA
jgi:hypothetical protein